MILCDPLIAIDRYRVPEEEQKRLSELMKERIDNKGWKVDTHGSYLDEPLLKFWKAQHPEK